MKTPQPVLPYYTYLNKINFWKILDKNDHSGYWTSDASCHLTTLLVNANEWQPYPTMLVFTSFCHQFSFPKDVQRIQECLAWQRERVVKGILLHIHANKIHEWPDTVLASTLRDMTDLKNAKYTNDLHYFCPSFSPSMNKFVLFTSL